MTKKTQVDRHKGKGYLLRLPPELHIKLKLESVRKSITLNSHIVAILERAAK